MVLFAKKTEDEKGYSTWRAAKRKHESGDDPAFEFDRKSNARGTDRPFIMVLLKDLPKVPPIPPTNLARNQQARQQTANALKETDGKTPFVLKVTHCNAIYSDAVGKPKADANEIYMNKPGGSLVTFVLSMFEDQIQVMDALTTTLPDVEWSRPGPRGNVLTGRPVHLHPEIWKFASSWMDLRIRTSIQSTKLLHYLQSSDMPNILPASQYNADQAEVSLKRQEIRPGIVTPTDFKVQQINSEVHGGDLEGDLALLRNWDQLALSGRWEPLRRPFFRDCWTVLYGRLTEDAADMIGMWFCDKRPLPIPCPR